MKGLRLLQTPSRGNLDLHSFLLRAHTCIKVAVFIQLYVEELFFKKEFLRVFILLGMCGMWRSEGSMLASVLPSDVEVRLRVSVRLEGNLVRWATS